MNNNEFIIQNVTAEMIKQVRKETRAGTIDCRQAIIESRGDTDRAIEILKKMVNPCQKKFGCKFIH